MLYEIHTVLRYTSQLRLLELQHWLAVKGEGKEEQFWYCNPSKYEAVDYNLYPSTIYYDQPREIKDTSGINLYRKTHRVMFQGNILKQADNIGYISNTQHKDHEYLLVINSTNIYDIGYIHLSCLIWKLLKRAIQNIKPT